MMSSQAELAGIKALAKTMSTKDLKWQVAHAKKLGIPANLNAAFKAELATRKEG